MSMMANFAKQINGKMDIGTVAIYLVGFVYGIAMGTYLLMSQMYNMLFTVVLYFVYLGIAWFNERHMVNMKAQLMFYEDMAEKSEAIMKQLGGINAQKETVN